MSKQFHVRVEGDFTLSVAEVWPDGDAPENPTAADVIAAMREYGERHGGFYRVIADWELSPEVIVVSDSDGGMEEWEYWQ